MKDVQCYELFGGITLKNYAFSFHIIYSSFYFTLLNYSEHIGHVVRMSVSGYRG